jgi:pyruvate dehydrogenase complex dehydrogenase (E1) component
MSQPTINRVKKRALWTLVGSFLLISAAQPTAYGLEFPMTTSISLPASANLNASIALNSEVDLSKGAALYTQLDKRTRLFASQMALAAAVSQQVEMARTIVGAKMVAKSIMFSEYAWGADQFTCLNRLWTKESHWNYRARNKKSGAHGIPQALPAIKMEVVSSDWRTNPVTQIRWGLRYIEARYDSPCKAWAKFKRSRYY